jgi:protein-L-isoaspartate(D-aspartate) O-methyltransferase
MENLTNIRHKYAQEIRNVLKRRNHINASEALIGAFAKVPREKFLGPGPWLIKKFKKSIWGKFGWWVNQTTRTGIWSSLTSIDPKDLYHDSLVDIDASQDLNNGQPSGLALYLHHLELREGDRVFHVGCGPGYYTAIMAEVVGPNGHVTSIDIDSELASRARENLAYLDHVEVLHGDGLEYDPGPRDAIFINAGVTHPQPLWFERLALGGRMVIPLTNDRGKGGVLRVKCDGQGYTARFFATTHIFNSITGRDTELSQRLHDGFTRGGWWSVQSLRREPHQPSNSCWLHSDRFCLSEMPVQRDN